MNFTETVPQQQQLDIPDLMPYAVRTSRRARRPSVSVCLHEGVVVTVPEGFDPRGVPRLLRQWQPWLRRQLQKADAARRQLPSECLQAIPDTVRLPALGHRWTVEYHPRAVTGVRLREGKSQLILSGTVSDRIACREALRRWLSRRARGYLSPELKRLAAEHGFQYRRLAVRGQRTRWGSCSSTGTISLNYLLLFLAPELVRCVLLHELCHTRHMNHGPHFRALLSRLESGYSELDDQLDRAWQSIPLWAWKR